MIRSGVIDSQPFLNCCIDHGAWHKRNCFSIVVYNVTSSSSINDSDNGNDNK